MLLENQDGLYNKYTNDSVWEVKLTDNWAMIKKKIKLEWTKLNNNNKNVTEMNRKPCSSALTTNRPTALGQDQEM